MPHLRLPDTTLYYELHGDGPETVVLLNGITMDSAGWYLQLPQLTRAYRVLTLDFRGQGRSARPVVPFYDLDRQADDVAELLQALDIRQAHVVGLSYGGMVAQHLVHRHPARVGRLVLASTLAHADAANAAIAASWSGAMATGGAELRFDMSKPWLYGSRLLREQAELVEAIREQGSLIDWEAVTRLMLGVSRHDARAWLAGIAAPTLVLVGDEDRLTPLYQARLLARGIPAARLVELSGCGHASHIEAPEAFNRAVAAFLAGH